ncbi:hypothetical protein QNH14_14135 [Apirhabdus apintestini]|nr:hypothetical protein QNH14_14135 [Enterobacteriaceae bacterium CA-0114]
MDYIKPEEKSDNGVRDTLVQQIQRLGLTLSPDELTATRYTQGALCPIPPLLSCSFSPRY